MATILTTTGRRIRVKPKSRAFTTDELQKFVGGFIEFIPLHDDQIMILNENGHFDPSLQLAENKNATKLYKKHLYKNVEGTPAVVPIVGNVVICSKAELAA